MAAGSTPKFCMECGNRLPSGAKFCPECGTQVSVPAPPESAPTPDVPESEPTPPQVPEELREKYERAQAELRGERRQVAVLFADVKGYTSLSESLDPEEVSFFMSGLLRELGEVVFRYEGHVDKFIGDAVMALFGAPIAHENDPERAVLAGLEMLEVVQRRNAETHFEIALRVGINLGEVVAGHVGSGDQSHYTVMGDAVNVASRLEGAAEPGTVLVSEEIHRRIADRYETEEVPPLSLKGKNQPVRAYRIGAYRRTLERRRATAFVGRDEELATAVEWIDAIAAGDSGALLVEADAGAGKSRLVAEALARAGDRVESLEIAFHPVRRPGALPAPAQLFHDLVPGDGAEERDAALALLGDEVDDHRPGVLGLAVEANPDAELEAPPATDPETARRSRWLALVALLARFARGRSVVIVVEDLHWADEAAREFLAFLLPALSEGVGAILAGRPPLGEVGGVPDDAQRIRLRPLGEEDVRAILGSLWYEMSPDDRATLVRRSQGNPLFLEELVRAVEAGEDDPTRLPGSLEAIIRSRIDRLSPPVQSLLQMAAVLGPRFPGGLLERIWSLDSHPIAYDAAIATLEEEGFFEPGAEGERRFHHALAQEVAYRGLLHRVRKVLHESAARIGEEVLADRIESEARFFAHHYWEAGLTAAAAPHLWRAGKAAAEGFDLATAETFLRRTAAALEDHPDVLDDAASRADFIATIGFVLLQRGELDDAEGWFHRLEELGEEAERPEWRVRGVEHRGRIQWYRGRLDEAAALFGEGLEALPEEASRLAADLRNGLGIVWLYRGDPDEAERHHRRALEIRERLGDVQGRAKSHLNLGNVLIDLAEDLDGARHHYDRARALAEEVGDRQLRATALANLGRIEMERGQWEGAIERFRDARERAAEIGWTYGRYLCLQNQAYCETWQGRIGDAVRRLQACRDAGEEVFEPVNRINTRLYLFEAWHRALADEKAAEMVLEARALLESLDVDEMEDEVRLIEGRELVATGAWEEAAEAFATSARAAERLSHHGVRRIAQAHRRRAEARAGRSMEPSTDDHSDDPPPVRRLLRYLAADTEATRNPSAETARRLEEVARAAMDEAEDRWLERAALARAGVTWEAAGERDRSRAAFDRAAAAARAVVDGLPEDLRRPFLTHPRNSPPPELQPS